MDVFHMVQGLHTRGLNITLFVLQLAGATGRGRIEGAALPFPVHPIPVACQNEQTIITAIREAVDRYKPTLVFLTHGYGLKPLVALALSHYPLVGRYYAHELMCARNPYRFKDLAPCPYDFLHHPDYCRKCALATLKPEIKSGHWSAWTTDYMLSRAYKASYHHHACTALKVMRRIIVYNESLRAELGPYQTKTEVIPGGINRIFAEKCLGQRRIQSKPVKKILLCGRVDDPAKGLAVLLEARTILLAKRHDFELVVTHFDPGFGEEHVTSTGWLTHEETLSLYESAHICVVPSLWHEPFGLVAVEAMAAGLPVCASNTGGLRDIVLHHRTGLLFPPGNAQALAGCLEQLLDDPDLRQTLGEAGRERALNCYTWDAVIDNHYLPLLESLSHE